MENHIAVVIIAHNEEDKIGKTLESVTAQTCAPYRIVCVDDASTDNTAQIVKGFDQVELVKITTQHPSYVGKKELASVINTGLKQIALDEIVDFVVILGADTILPDNYFSKLAETMEKDEKIVVASGMMSGEYSQVPRGSGRMVRASFWRKIGLRYPVNYGFEAYLILKAESMGQTVTICEDLIMHTQRTTGSTYEAKRYIYYGMAMKCLGYTFRYVLGRGMLLMKRNPLGGIYIIFGYFSDNVDLYEPELREFVRNTQKNLKLTFYLNRLKGKW